MGRKAQEGLECAGLGLWIEDGSGGLDGKFFHPEVIVEDMGLSLEDGVERCEERILEHAYICVARGRRGPSVHMATEAQ